MPKPIKRKRKRTMAPFPIQKLGYSFVEARAATSLSRRTLEYLIQKGALQATKIGRRTIIQAKSLEQLLQTRKSPAAKPGF